MKCPPLADLPATAQRAVASAGYRLARWRTARQVLEQRSCKKRLPQGLLAFLETWMPSLPPADQGLEVRLEGCESEIWLSEGGLAGFPEERALLHLPALRFFWTVELRRSHFDVLRHMVPPVWFMDQTLIPPGAVIAGLGTAVWKQATDVIQHEQLLLRVKKAAWSALARYQCDAKGRITLTDWQGMS